MSNRSRGFGRIPQAKQQSGLSRAKLYQIAAKHRGLFRKADGATIVDLDMLDQILDALPAAKIGRGREAEAEQVA